MMELHGFGDDLIQRHPRVQGRVRILEDDLHGSSKEPKLMLGHPGDIGASKQNVPRSRLDKFHQGKARGSFSASCWACSALAMMQLLSPTKCHPQ